MVVDVKHHFGEPAAIEASLSDLARGVVGSEILKIAAQIRGLVANGEKICNLTVGDFDPKVFPIPESLLAGIQKALRDGHTNYPPSDGVPTLREAIARFYKTGLGLDYPVESVLVTGGARPLLYGSYRTILDPGDVAVYPVPSWNNNHYGYLMGAKKVEIAVRPEDNFFPTPEQIRPVLGSARLLLINSPLNPCGTVIDPAQLEAISKLAVEENRRRAKTRSKALWMVYDQVYWQLTFGDARHATPVGLVPEMAPFTVMLDAASKSFCGTGLRVGWGVMPPEMRQKMADILGHVGAWAPKAEQIAVAALLDDADGMRRFLETMRAHVRERLDLLSDGFRAMKKDGYPVDTMSPQGAIYLSAKVAVPGNSNEDTRKLLLERAGFAVVPFQAFGLKEESGWFRLSVGAVSTDEIRACFPRLRDILPRR